MSSSDDDAPAPVLPLRKRRRVCTKNLVSSSNLFNVKLKPALNQAEQDISKILQGTYLHTVLLKFNVL